MAKKKDKVVDKPKTLTVKDCYNNEDWVVSLKIFGKDIITTDIDHLNDNVYEITYDDPESENPALKDLKCKVSAEHAVTDVGPFQADEEVKVESEKVESDEKETPASEVEPEEVKSDSSEKDEEPKPVPVPDSEIDAIING